MHFRFKFKQQGPAPACTALNPLSRDTLLSQGNMYIQNIETYYYVKYKLYNILNISSQTVNINHQVSDWEALVSSEV